MPPQSAICAAITTITTAITVAAGVFAPGHVGELTRVVPFELVDAVLEETGTRERRLRLLPSRVGVYFVLAMCLFPRPGYLGIWAKLTAALGGPGVAVPSAKALRELRRRIGVAPLKALFETLAGPLGQPRTPGVMFGRYRTVAFDGCRSLKVPDTGPEPGLAGQDESIAGRDRLPGHPADDLVRDRHPRADRRGLRHYCHRRARLGAQAAAPAGRHDAGADGPRL